MVRDSSSSSIALFRHACPVNNIIKAGFHKGRVVTILIIYMKKILDSDWLRAVQLKCNTSAKSVTPVQKSVIPSANYKDF